MKMLFLFAGCCVLGASASAGVIYDTLWFVDQYTYDTGNGDAYSGKGVFGAAYDLMVADDFEASGRLQITRVAADYVSFYGTTPHDGAEVTIYEKMGGHPFDNILSSGLFPYVRAEAFTDTKFGLMGIRLWVDTIGPQTRIFTQPGTNWIKIQPRDLTRNGDWYYILRDLDSRIGGDSYLTNGCRGGG